jgi:hypothetical protein
VPKGARVRDYDHNCNAQCRSTIKARPKHQSQHGIRQKTTVCFAKLTHWFAVVKRSFKAMGIFAPFQRPQATIAPARVTKADLAEPTAADHHPNSQCSLDRQRILCNSKKTNGCF